MSGFDFNADGRRTEFLQMLANKLDDPFRALVGNKPAGNLYSGPRWDDRLAALALIAAG
jgi:hypothetical protein